MTPRSTTKPKASSITRSTSSQTRRSNFFRTTRSSRPTTTRAEVLKPWSRSRSPAGENCTSPVTVLMSTASSRTRTRPPGFGKKTRRREVPTYGPRHRMGLRGDRCRRRGPAGSGRLLVIHRLDCLLCATALRNHLGEPCTSKPWGRRSLSSLPCSR